MDGLGQVLVVQSGGETQEHLFKECGGWKGEIHTLWKKVGDISGERKDYKDGGGSTPKSGKTSALTMPDRGIHPSETYQETGRPPAQCSLFRAGGSGWGRTKNVSDISTHFVSFFPFSLFHFAPSVCSPASPHVIAVYGYCGERCRPIAARRQDHLGRLYCQPYIRTVISTCLSLHLHAALSTNR